MNWNEAIQQLHGEPVTQGELSKADGRTLGGARTEPILTLRDYFAAKATDEDVFRVIGGYDEWNLARMLNIKNESVREDIHGAIVKARVKARYIWADAMLAERTKP